MVCGSPVSLLSGGQRPLPYPAPSRVGLHPKQPGFRGLELGICEGSGDMETRQPLQLIGQLAGRRRDRLLAGRAPV
jgi:hypothetical protein